MDLLKGFIMRQVQERTRQTHDYRVFIERDVSMTNVKLPLDLYSADGVAKEESWVPCEDLHHEKSGELRGGSGQRSSDANGDASKNGGSGDSRDASGKAKAVLMREEAESLEVTSMISNGRRRRGNNTEDVVNRGAALHRIGLRPQLLLVVTGFAHLPCA